MTDSYVPLLCSHSMAMRLIELMLRFCHDYDTAV